MVEGATPITSASCSAEMPLLFRNAFINFPVSILSPLCLNYSKYYCKFAKIVVDICIKASRIELEPQKCEFGKAVKYELEQTEGCSGVKRLADG